MYCTGALVCGCMVLFVHMCNSLALALTIARVPSCVCVCVATDVATQHILWRAAQHTSSRCAVCLRLPQAGTGFGAPHFQFQTPACDCAASFACAHLTWLRDACTREIICHIEYVHTSRLEHFANAIQRRTANAF